MTIQRATSHIPATPVLVAGVGAPLVGVLALAVLPPLWLLGPFSGLVAVLLTAGAARYVARGLTGAAIARSGLVVGAVSAGVGLLLAGLGVVSVLLAVLTVIAGVAGAVAGRGVTDRG